MQFNKLLLVVETLASTWRQVAAVLVFGIYLFNRVIVDFKLDLGLLGHLELTEVKVFVLLFVKVDQFL